MGQRKGAAMGHNKGVQRTRNARIASGKYPGCIIAAAFAPAVARELRSKAAFALFSLGPPVAGIWPYLRNFVWTHNPVFPFLSPALSPALVTAYAVKALAEQRPGLFDSRASATVSFFVFRGDAEA